LVGLVEAILIAKRANPQADTTKLERQIDRLVYNLYDLNDEEIEIVEESVQPSE
jgi:adenine-specific DNA-methyltransferase